jgi:hypothetical protein
MFGQPKPIVFDPYGRRRPRRRVPRWLVLLLSGTAIGAGGLIFVQERYLPPRLSAGETAALRAQFKLAESERLRLQKALDDTTQRLQATLASEKSLGVELADSQASAERLREDLASAVAALPPDPRGGGVEVRAGRFTAKAGTLAYDVVLSRERKGSKAMNGVMQLTVAGESARGTEQSVSLAPVTLSVAGHEVLRGSLPLPEGFKPRQTTIQVLDRAGGKALGMRVMPVR